MQLLKAQILNFGKLNNQVYYLNEQVARQKNQIEELQQILRQNT